MSRLIWPSPHRLSTDSYMYRDIIHVATSTFSYYSTGFLLMYSFVA